MTGAKGQAKQQQQRWLSIPASLRPQYLGDMAGTWDHWVLLASFLFSLTTAAVGVFQMIDKPYTAQGDLRWFLLLSVFWAIHNMVSLTGWSEHVSEWV